MSLEEGVEKKHCGLAVVNCQFVGKTQGKRNGKFVRRKQKHKKKTRKESAQNLCFDSFPNKMSLFFFFFSFVCVCGSYIYMGMLDLSSWLKWCWW